MNNIDSLSIKCFFMFINIRVPRLLSTCWKSSLTTRIDHQ